ncbi:matrixin family metalloprotease [Pseudobacillus badius]|uniref:matrixin family metalloprotease n=1 Tax=Bacillus badius TaxID=1455 RepID=UPI003D344AE4
MKKRNAFIAGIGFLLISLFTNLKSADAAPTVVVIEWNLVDLFKHMDWDGDSKYLENFKYGVGVWEDYKKGVIREDTLFTVEDVFVSDYEEVSSTVGVTSPQGTIRFNDYKVSYYDDTSLNSVATHEVGHALGLGHNTEADVMSPHTNGVVTLSENDKASYDEAYKSY